MLMQKQLCYTAFEAHPQSVPLNAAKQLMRFSQLRVQPIHHLRAVTNLTVLFAKTSLIGIALAVPLLSFTAIADASHCHTIAQDWDGSVDLRSQPQRNIFNLIDTIPNGTYLNVVGQSGDWLQVYTSGHHFSGYYQAGWVRERATRRVCSRDDSSFHSSPSLPPLPPLPPLSPLSPDWEYDEYNYDH